MRSFVIFAHFLSLLLHRHRHTRSHGDAWCLVAQIAHSLLKFLNSITVRIALKGTHEVSESANYTCSQITDRMKQTRTSGGSGGLSPGDKTISALVVVVVVGANIVSHEQKTEKR